MNIRIQAFDYSSTSHNHLHWRESVDCARVTCTVSWLERNLCCSASRPIRSTCRQRVAAPAQTLAGQMYTRILSAGSVSTHHPGTIQPKSRKPPWTKSPKPYPRKPSPNSIMNTSRLSLNPYAISLALNPKPYTLTPKPPTLNPNPLTKFPLPLTLNLEHWILNSTL